MRRRLLCVLTLASLAGLQALAQSPSAPSAPITRATAQATPGAPIVLGDSAAELYGPWKFHTGDDPSWSNPDFNDAAWDNMDLTPPAGSADPELGTSGFIPGWTARGYDNYSGYAWYRLRVNVQGARTRLALRMPSNFDDAYEVFVNGKLIGNFGTFNAHRVTIYAALPRSFKLPSSIGNGPITIAVRMWMDSATPFNSPDAGGMHGPPVIGYAPVIATQVRIAWDDNAHHVGSGFLESLVLILALVVTLTHFRLDPRDKAYLWLGLVASATLIGNTVVLLASFTTWIPQTTAIIVRDVIIAPLRLGLWVLFWSYWFRVRRVNWLHRTVWSLVVLQAIGTLLLRPPLYGQTVPVHFARSIVPVLLVAKLVFAAMLFWLIYLNIRRRRAEGWLVLPVVLLAVLASYQPELRQIHIPTNYNLFGFRISLGTASTMLSLLIVTVLASWRFLHFQRKKVQWRLEVEQAREVQQVLIPKELPRIDGLNIESEYRPAREVGGDFFQIVPIRQDGSVLLVVGDVTGKGLHAGMLVALIVGIIHTVVHSNPDPEFILKTLNSRLCERSHTSATCLVLRITAAGVVTIVNAGHLPPYLNGSELNIEGSLPLGIIPTVDLPVATVTMNEGDTLTLMSDGVAEAQDQNGHMFGFDRIQAMLRDSATAADLASAAQLFGQEDDILVLRIERRAGTPQAPLEELKTLQI